MVVVVGGGGGFLVITVSHPTFCCVVVEVGLGCDNTHHFVVLGVGCG